MKTALKGITLLFVTLLMFSCSSTSSNKLNSKFGGVQVGAISYSFRSMPDQSIPAIIDYYVECGINSIELMGGPVEAYVGAPSIPRGEDQAPLREWRLSVSMDKFKEMKALFDEKGIDIHILKLGSHNWTDAEIDYAFNAAKAVGAKAICMEISEDAAERMAPFADKHNMYVALHNHAQPGDPSFSFDHMLSFGKNLMLNFDAGHYMGATGLHPNDLITRLHDRILSIHIKDKTSKNNVEPNQNRQFGEGETPIYEILQLLKKEKWPIYVDIELEYQIPETSNAVIETAKCVEYLKNGLI